MTFSSTTRISFASAFVDDVSKKCARTQLSLMFFQAEKQRSQVLLWSESNLGVLKDRKQCVWGGIVCIIVVLTLLNLVVYKRIFCYSILSMKKYRNPTYLIFGPILYVQDYKLLKMVRTLEAHVPANHSIKTQRCQLENK